MVQPKKKRETCPSVGCLSGRIHEHFQIQACLPGGNLTEMKLCSSQNMTSGARVGSLDHRVHVVLGQLSAPYHHHFSLCDWHVFCGRRSEATPISCSSVGNLYTLDLAAVDDSCLSQLLLIIVVKWWFSVSRILYLLNYKLALYYILQHYGLTDTWFIQWIEICYYH